MLLTRKIKFNNKPKALIIVLLLIQKKHNREHKAGLFPLYAQT